MLVILADHPTHLVHASFFSMYQELQFPEIVLFLHRRIRRFSQLVGGKTCSLGRASKLFSYSFYTSIFLKSRRYNTAAVSSLLTVLSLLVMSELLD